MTKHILLPLALLVLSTYNLLAQVDPKPVNSPQRQTSYGESDGGGFFLWIGLALAVLIVVLVVLRGKSSTRSRIHRTNN